MRPVGRTVWAIPGGHIPLRTTGREPEETSSDTVCLLNAGAQDAEIEMLVYYEDLEPIGPYRLKVPARRTRHIRFNDLIDPEALPLDTDFAAVITSNVPIVVEFTRKDTSRDRNAIATTLAFPGD
ncbi:hypothetical protein ES707_22436 [subsurface metagenome]